MLAHQGGVDESLALFLLFAGVWTGWIGWSRLRGTGFPRLPGWSPPVLISGAVVLAISAAIVPRALFPRTPSGARPPSSATLSIVSPAPGQEVDGSAMDVVLDLEGGRIVDQTSTRVQPDVGHIHLSIDGHLVSMLEGPKQLLDIGSLSAGSHTLEAEFVASDHGPFRPAVTASVTFTKGPG